MRPMETLIFGAQDDEPDHAEDDSDDSDDDEPNAADDADANAERYVEAPNFPHSSLLTQNVAGNESASSFVSCDSSSMNYWTLSRT